MGMVGQSKSARHADHALDRHATCDSHAGDSRASRARTRSAPSARNLTGAPERRDDRSAAADNQPALANAGRFSNAEEKDLPLWNRRCTRQVQLRLTRST